MDIASLLPVLSTPIPAYFALGPLVVLLFILLGLMMKKSQTPGPVSITAQPAASITNISSSPVANPTVGNTYVAPPAPPLPPVPPSIAGNPSPQPITINPNPNVVQIPVQTTQQVQQPVAEVPPPVTVVPTPISQAPVPPPVTAPVTETTAQPPVASWKPIPQAPVGTVSPQEQVTPQPQA
jgi:hypothetical protein